MSTTITPIRVKLLDLDRHISKRADKKKAYSSSKMATCIEVLANKPQRTSKLTTLARELNTTTASMTAISDALEDLGLCMKSRCPMDRRAWLLSLNPLAQKFLA